MLRIIVLVVAAVFAGASAFAQSDRVSSTQPQAKIRIGVYDSRAIAVAYAPSRFNPVREKMAEHQAAKAAGDQKKVKELQAWGAQHQRMLHLQGFCRVPVTDLLEPVKEQMDKLAAEQRLAAIVMACDVASPDVQIVDVTEQIIEFYDPSDRTRQMAAQIRKTEPASVLTVAGSDKR